MHHHVSQEFHFCQQVHLVLPFTEAFPSSLNGCLQSQLFLGVHIPLLVPFIGSVIVVEISEHLPGGLERVDSLIS